jgi:hypothetical protein
VAVMSPGGLEGIADVDPYRMQWQVMAAPRSRMLHSAGVVTTVPGVGLYARGRPPAVNSGRDGAPPA